MGAPKKGNSLPRPRMPLPVVALYRWMSGPGRTASILLTILAVFFGVWHFVWQAVRPSVVAANPYWLARENIETTPLPPWIHCASAYGDGMCVRDEVFRELSVDRQLSILDGGLVDRVRKAFSLHPWVSKVVSVQVFHPARVCVELVYRRPVLMVQVGNDFAPVDVEGVVLPAEGFSPTEKRAYPQFVGIEAGPLGPLGTRWGDPRVAGAAGIAALLQPIWEPYGLSQIVATHDVNPVQPQEVTYDLVPVRGLTKIFWGHAPGAEAASEASAAAKVAMLKKLFADYHTLEWSKDAPPIDLTRAPPVDVNRATKSP
jgi:hypothetical protein